MRYSILWQNFFSTIYSKYAVFSFFSMIHEHIPGYATHTHSCIHVLENTHAYRENIFVVFFFSSLFLKTTSPVHYCRCSLITRMPWYCKPVKISIYIYIPLHTLRSIQLTTLVPDVAVPIFTHSFSLSFFFSFFFLVKLTRRTVLAFVILSSVPALCLRTVFLYKITSLWHLLSYPASPKRLLPNCVHATHCSQGKNEYRAAGAIYTGGRC